MSKMILDSLFTQDELKSFFGASASRHAVRSSGGEQECLSLFDWQKLNRVLSECGPGSDRLRLVLGDKVVDEAEYVRQNALAPSSHTLVTHAVNERLKAGAVLVLSGVDQMESGLTNVARELERRLCAEIAMSVEASTAATPDRERKPLWRPYDILALQVCGSQRWLVLGETQKEPVDPYSPFMQEPPVTGPECELVVEAGAGLLIPRGCWFSVEPLHLPTLTLTVSITAPTNWNLASWLLDRMKRHEFLRSNVPLFADQAARREYLKTLRQVFHDALQDDELLDDFTFCWNGMATARPRFSLPAGGQMTSPAWDEGNVVRVLGSRPFVCRQISGEPVIESLMNGRYNRFHIEARQILECLLNGSAFTLGELHERFSDACTKEQISELVADLADLGLVAVER